MSKANLTVLFLCALIFAIFLNEINLRYVQEINPTNVEINARSRVENSTIWSADNDWYLPQIKHLEAGHGYTLEPLQPEMRVRRTPVYPLFYGLFYWLFGEKNSFVTIKIVQSLLFAISACLLALTVFNLSNGNKSWSLITGYLYALMPFIPSYLSFTITEGLSPFTVVLTLYFFSQYIRHYELKYLFLCGFALALSFLTRPLCGVLLIGLTGYLFLSKSGFRSLNNLLTASKKPFILTIAFCVYISPWAIRNYMLTGDLIVAEKIYYGAPMNKGKSLVELRLLVSSWTNPTNLSTEIFSSKLEHNIIAESAFDNEKVIDEFIQEWPDLAFQGYSRAELKQALFLVNNCLIEKHTYRVENPNPPIKEYLTLPCEQDAYEQLNLLRSAFKKSDPLRYFVLTPAKTLKETVFNSNLHQMALVNPLDGDLNKWQLILKSVAYLLNVIMFLSLIPFILYNSDRNLNLLLIAPITTLAVALTIFLFRYVEYRYFLPLYPLMYISLGYLLHRLNEKYNLRSIFLDKNKSR